MKRFVHTVLLLAAIGSVTACDMADSHETKYAGTPAQWWSDGYMTMVQEVNNETVVPVAKKPTRIRIF